MKTHRLLRSCFGLLVALALMLPLASASAAHPRSSSPLTTGLSAAPEWSGWSSMGRLPITDGTSYPVVGTGADGHLELFVGGLRKYNYGYGEEGVYRNYQLAPNGAWSGWQQLGDSTVSLPGVVTTVDGVLDVFASYRVAYNPGPPPVSTYGVMHRYETSPGGNWSNWTSLGTPPGLVSIHLSRRG